MFRLENIILANDTPFTSEDFLNKLFPNFWSWLINFLALIVLFIAVYFIAYKPIKKVIKARKDYVENNIRDSEQAKAINERKASEADSLVTGAKSEANEIIKKAKADASVKAEEIANEAKEDAARRQKEADVAIKQAEEKSRLAIQDEIVNIAIDASSQVLGRNVTDEDNKRLVSGFVSEVNKKNKGNPDE